MKKITTSLNKWMLMVLGMVLLSSPTLLAQDEECMVRRMTDSLVLVALYEATDGENWEHEWDFEEPIDEWYGVILDEEDCGVEALELANNGLTGGLSELYFPLLKIMDLSDNELTGILTDFDLFPLIEEIYLNNNQFFGPVPFLGEFEELEFVDISNNRFTFEGMEELANSNIDEVIYNPQATIPVTLTGSKLEVDAGGTLTNNTYNWYKDGEFWVSLIGDNDVLVSEDGEYFVMVRNSEVTEMGDEDQELFLRSDTITYVADCTIPETPTLVVDETHYCVEDEADIIFYVKQIDVPEDFYFQWLVDGNPFVNNNEFEQVFVGTEVTEFEVSMRITDGNGCDSDVSNSITIVVEACEAEEEIEGDEEVGTTVTEEEEDDDCPEMPTPVLTVSDTVVCEGDYITLTILPDPEDCIIEIYQDGNLVNEQKDSIFYITEPGKYYALFTDPYGCPSEQSNIVSVQFIDCGITGCENDTIYECTTGFFEPVTVCPDFCVFPDGDFAITSVTTNHFSCSISILDQFCSRFTPLPAFVGKDTLRIIACDTYGVVCDTVFVVINVTDDCNEESGFHGFNVDNLGLLDLMEIKNDRRSEGLINLYNIGGERIFNDDLIHVYPNPAQDYVYINFGTKELQAYQIYNVLGQRVTIGDFDEVEGRALTLDVSQYHSGLYFIEIFEEGQESEIYQFMVE